MKSCYTKYDTMTTNAPSRSYVFTINNYTDDDLNAIGDIDTEDGNIFYLIAGLEVGESGTPHIQGYVECKPTRMKAMCKLLGGRAYLAIRRGTREQARDYCKKDGNFIEVGAWSTKGQGRRTDLERLMEATKKNQAVKEIMETIPETYSRHMRFAEKYRALCERETTRAFRHVETTVLWGKAGCGKTRYVNDKEEKIFWVHPEDKQFAFDGYDGEEAIAFDDFYGNMQHHIMLRVLDGHQLLVNVKGGHRYANWKRVYITSNAPPEDWYGFGLKPELARRLTRVIHLNTTVTAKSFTDNTQLDQVIPFSTSNTECNEAGGNNSAPAVTLDCRQSLTNLMSYTDVVSTPIVGLRQDGTRAALPCPPHSSSTEQGAYGHRASIRHLPVNLVDNIGLPLECRDLEAHQMKKSKGLVCGCPRNMWRDIIDKHDASSTR